MKNIYIKERNNNEDFIVQIMEKDGMKKRIAKFNILLKKIKIVLSKN